MKLFSLTSYLGLIWTLLVSFCLAPGESLALETTQYSRVVAQAERIAYLAAQRSALASQVATAALAPSASSFAIRFVAGPVGWAALGVGAGLVLAQMYYSQPDLAAIKTAASPPAAGKWRVPMLAPRPFQGSAPIRPANANYPNATIQFSATNVPLCAIDTEYQHDWVVGPFQSVEHRRLVPRELLRIWPCGRWPDALRLPSQGIPGSRRRCKMRLIPPTPQQAANYVTGLPASDPKSIEAHTNPVGTTGTTQPADTPSRSLWLRVRCRRPSNRNPCLPATLSSWTVFRLRPVRRSRIRNSKPPPRRQRRHRIRTARRRKQEETQATTSCTAGTHENRTFGTVLQAHQTIWATSGLLSTLNLLKSLTWPSTLPVIALPSVFFGNQQVDFNQWAWFFTVLRTLVIAIASFAAYRIIFVGGGQTT